MDLDESLRTSKELFMTYVGHNCNVLSNFDGPGILGLHLMHVFMAMGSRVHPFLVFMAMGSRPS